MMQFVRATEKIFKDESRNKKMNEKEMLSKYVIQKWLDFISVLAQLAQRCLKKIRIAECDS